jgi:hypothetical protein
MFNRWLSSKTNPSVQKRFPNASSAGSLSHSGLYFGCSWCPHPIGQAYVLININHSTLPSKTHGFVTGEDLNP